MSYLRDQAEELAIRAKFGDNEQTQAVGEGLAAIAYALLDVAQAIRETAAE